CGKIRFRERFRILIDNVLNKLSRFKSYVRANTALDRERSGSLSSGKARVDAIRISLALAKFLRQTRSKSSAAEYVVHHDRRIEILVDLAESRIANPEDRLYGTGNIVKVHLSLRRSSGRR